ncbi:hypothetical protein NUU61_002238 [Penicillium alfredii]|uniref:Uncharacterized protein n=1 Tax=Penicillium alfredii TaxID=1506179 RepID=A0A9W9FR57_9EURO|nr:uncharacterized protein NUU61_002238 [Penicillium alfredii]KAJ5104891.1 hypothetical protein NUU61_002238 [Penicillium alfredii]
MKFLSTLYSTFLISALAVSCLADRTSERLRNPWTRCGLGEMHCNTGTGSPTWKQIDDISSHWRKGAVEVAKQVGADSNPSDQTERECGSPYGSGCATNENPDKNSDARMASCRKPDGILGTDNCVPDVCVSIYLDAILDQCRDENGEDGLVSGKVHIPDYKASIEVFTV